MLRLAAMTVGVTLAVTGMAAAQSDTLVVDLKSACTLAAKQNPRIRSAEASTGIAQAAVGRAKSELSPRLDVNSNYSYINEETMFGNTTVLANNTWINRIIVQQTVYSGGRVRATVRQAEQGRLAATYSASATQADVVTSAAQAYFVARQAKEGIAVAEASVKSAEANYSDARKLQEAGVVTRSDVLRAEVALTAARNDLITATNDYNKALANLKTTLGVPQDTPVDLATQTSDTGLDEAETLEPVQRPFVSAGEAALGAAEAGRKAAKAGKRPTVALFADFQNEPVGAEFPRLSNTVMAGVMVNLNVFDGGLTRANINEAEAAVAKAGSDLDTAKQAAALQLEAARLDLESAKAKVETTQSQVQSAEESLRVLKTGYREGITPLTDVLTGETALTGAQVMRLAALYEVRIAQVNLLQALGRTGALCE